MFKTIKDPQNEMFIQDSFGAELDYYSLLSGMKRGK
jgi:hypothetical protein